MASSHPSDTNDESGSDVYPEPDWDYGHDSDSNDGLQDKTDDEGLELPESNVNAQTNTSCLAPYFLQWQY
jgi:hypothetical protein